MNDKNLKRILNNLQEKMFFAYIGEVNIYDFDKIEIKNLTKAIKETDKENPNNEKWEQDKNYLTQLINDWCVAFRCYSLFIY